MLAPLSYLSAAGLLLVAGALLTSTSLAGVLPFLRWPTVQLLGQLIYKCLTAVISNLSVLFCVGIAAALAKQEKHQAGLIALMCYLIYLTAGNVTLTALGQLAKPDASPACTVRARPPCWASRPWTPACSAAFCWALRWAASSTAPAMSPTKASCPASFPARAGPSPVRRHWQQPWALGPASSGRRCSRVPRRLPASSRPPAMWGCSSTAFWNGCSSPRDCTTWCTCRSSSHDWAGSWRRTASPTSGPMWS